MSKINFDLNNISLKSILKSLKLNESNISMVLGAVVIVVAGILVANYFKNKNQGQILPPVTNEATTPTSGKTYTVVAGDTLWAIAEKAYGSGYNWSDVAKANNLTDANNIQAGQKLTIPEVAMQKPAVSTPVSDQQAISGGTHTVVKGDNLWTIAVRAYGDGYKWTMVAKENNLKNPNLIHSGNVLTLPR